MNDCLRKLMINVFYFFNKTKTIIQKEKTTQKTSAVNQHLSFENKNVHL